MKALFENWSEIQFVFESPDGHSVLKRLEESETLPEVMLLDIGLPPKGTEEFDGPQVLKELKVHYPNMKVIILSVHDDEYLIAQMIEQGAHGYLVKDSDPLEVRDAIHAVHEKGAYINTRTLQAIQGKMEGKVKAPKAHESLSKREVEVFQLICQQLTSEEIGEKLFISRKTVDGHINNLLQKTDSPERDRPGDVCGEASAGGVCIESDHPSTIATTLAGPAEAPFSLRGKAATLKPE